VNTNLNVPRKLIDKLIEYSNKLKGKVKTFDVYTSCEATGPQAEYIRYGMTYDEFTDNCRYFLKNTEVRLHFMVATNLLSVTTFSEFLQFVYTLRTEFNENDSDNRIPMMIAYVRWPQHLNIRNLPDDVKQKYGPIWRETVMTRTRQTSPNKAGRFYLEEIDQVERLIDFMNGTDDMRMKNMKDFFLYHEQYDERRDTNFYETFPELIPYYEDCRNLVEMSTNK
jgi:hypothetical protein